MYLYDYMIKEDLEMNIHDLDLIYIEENLSEELEFLSQDFDLPAERWDESFRDEFYNEEDDDYDFLQEFYDISGNPLKPGQIAMVKDYVSKNGRQTDDPHRVLIVSASSPDRFGVAEYKGYLMSSNTDKANVKSKYVNNIFIDDFSTICARGTQKSMNDHKSAIIKVDELVEFTNEDMDDSGVWKATAKSEFIKLVAECRRNFASGKQQLNKNMQWKH